ncbi:ABC transporter ATP-binding protein/permease [Myxococcota bacterium]|nr:ABC transporter ATP-binding protein/permease [Myxococcota bacterium]
MSPQARRRRNTDLIRGENALRRLFSFARPYAPLIVIALLLSAGYSGTRYLRAYLVKPLLDEVVVPGAVLADSSNSPSWLPLPELSSETIEQKVPPDLSDPPPPLLEIRERFLEIAATAALLVLAMPALMFARGTVTEYFLGRVHIDIKRRVCSQLLVLPLRFYRDRKRGDLLSRTLQDVDTAHGALGIVFGNLFQALLSIPVGIAFLFAISWPLALVTLVLGPLVFGVIFGFGRRVRRTARHRQETLADVTQRLVEMLAGIKIIRAFGGEERERAAFDRETERFFRRSMRVVRNRMAARSLVEMLNSAIGVGIVVGGAWVVASGWSGLTTGDLAAFSAVLASTYKPVKDIARAWVRIMDAEPAASRFFELLDAPPVEPDSPDAVSIPRLSERITLRDVSFDYGGSPVLNSLSLEIKAGQRVAIVGRSGAGKTTLADLLLRFADPTSGRIEVDGVDLRRISRDSWTQQISVVTQEPFLFDGSLRENIAYGRPDASESEILAAARTAHVAEFANELDQGYETRLGDNGARLSGGQRQRVTLARALLKNPSVLVLDEATSALDHSSERWVQEAMDNRLGDGQTILVIAHRLSTVRRADRIAVLAAGRIVQWGSHEELLAQDGPYRELIGPPMGRGLDTDWIRWPGDTVGPIGH